MTPSELEAAFEQIAREEFLIPTLERQGRNGLDFHDVGVVSIKRALQAAYELGLAANT
jgi:hypothetical protein